MRTLAHVKQINLNEAIISVTSLSVYEWMHLEGINSYQHVVIVVLMINVVVVVVSFITG